MEIDRDRVAAYSEVCGFPLQEALPVTYPHMLAFPLHMAIMTDGSFPFPAIGTVPGELDQPAPADLPRRALQVTARPDNLRPHANRAFDIVVDIHSAGELVWQSTSTLLRLGKGDKAAAERANLRGGAARPTTWKLPGTSAAALRPCRATTTIPSTASPPRRSASAADRARDVEQGPCLAALDGRLPDAVTVEVAFEADPAPGTVAFGSHRTGEDYAFSLTSPRNGAPHLLGRASPLHTSG